MLAPLSWLKEYVDITLNPETLAERLTEIGLGVEKITKTEDDVVFELEITPNRGDLLSIVGIAREIAALEGKKLHLPKIKTNVLKIKPKKVLPFKIKPNYNINPRFTGLLIDNVTVKKSPLWLQEKLLKIGQRPINNIVDITNFVMFELGNPIHAFDYHKVSGQKMTVHQTKGGEEFTSVDNIKYRLPKGAVVISDGEKIIDLCGIKGGLNSATLPETKTIFIRVPVEDAVLARRASQVLGLRSEASSIFERGVNRNGTIKALERCADLIMELAGGEIASKLYDFKRADFSPWKLSLRLGRLKKILGFEILEKKVIDILGNLNLSPRKTTRDIIETTIPTYRNDLKLEEDLIEEVARLFGYNNFPKTSIVGKTPFQTIPYFKNFALEEKVKNLLLSCGFSEIYTYSMLSEKDLMDENFNPPDILRIDNPVSRDFEYLRPTLKIGLVKALKQNKANYTQINLFELGKVYLGKSLDEATEKYFLSGISSEKSFYEIKGVLQKIFKNLGINDDPSNLISMTDDGIIFEVDFSSLLQNLNLKVSFVPLPKYPPIIEDLAIVVNPKIKVGEIISEIKKQSRLIVDISLLDQFENAKTFHIVYQHKESNLTTQEVAVVRKRILTALKEKFNARLKE